MSASAPVTAVPTANTPVAAQGTQARELEFESSDAPDGVAGDGGTFGSSFAGRAALGAGAGAPTTGTGTSKTISGPDRRW